MQANNEQACLALTIRADMRKGKERTPIRESTAGLDSVLSVVVLGN